MPAKVILNPYAGRWKAQEKRLELETALRKSAIDFEIEVTKNPGNGIELASHAVRDGFAPIIAAGGDGSISEVVNGIARTLVKTDQKEWPPLGIIPLGSANDLAVNLGLPQDINKSVQVLAANNTRLMDLGLITYGVQKKTRYFDNNSAIGLEPTITLIQQRITRLRGVIRYLVATLMGIAQNPQWTMHIEWEDGEYEGPVTLVSVGINPLTGGLFYMTPHADPFDGLLTFVHGYISTRLQILRILPRTMKPGEGSFIEHPAVNEIHSPWIRIRTTTPTPLHADGEIQSESVRQLEYKILPSCIPVLMD
jgi:YegS/Rv2252/BmrU family lipid kinase